MKRVVVLITATVLSACGTGRAEEPSACETARATVDRAFKDHPLDGTGKVHPDVQGALEVVTDSPGCFDPEVRAEVAEVRRLMDFMPQG